MESAGSALVNPKIIFQKIKLAPGERVADLGCGRTGHFIFQASRVVGEQGIVYAVDIIKNVLENIESRCKGEGYLNIQTIWSDIERLGKTPIPPASVKASFLINVLYLVKSKVAALQEATRLVETGGYVIVVDWLKKLGPLGPEPSVQVRPEAAIEDAKEAGLTLIEQFAMGDNHYCLLFKK